MDENLKREIIDLLKNYDLKDSIELGNTKTGKVKVYVNFNNEEEAVAKINNALKILKEKSRELME